VTVLVSQYQQKTPLEIRNSATSFHETERTSADLYRKTAINTQATAAMFANDTDREPNTLTDQIRVAIAMKDHRTRSCNRWPENSQSKISAATGDVSSATFASAQQRVSVEILGATVARSGAMIFIAMATLIWSVKVFGSRSVSFANIAAVACVLIAVFAIQIRGWFSSVSWNESR